MKKVIGSLFLTVVLLFSTHVLSAEASGVETYMSPRSITNSNEGSNSITISTNVGGTSSFQFNPGNGEPRRDRRNTHSHTFSQKWTYHNSPYTYTGQVVNQMYGPGPLVTGKATITFN